MKGPSFIIPGFSKCGTTWVYQRLHELIEFTMPPQKELHFFNRDMNYHDGEAGAYNKYFVQRKKLLRNFNIEGINFLTSFFKFWESNDQTYLKLFDNLNGISGDITPIYILLENRGIEKMSKLLKGIPILFILRDPIERAWSQFRMMYKQDSSQNEIDIENALSFFKKKLQVRRSDYKRGVELFRDNFKSSKIGITFYDKLESNPYLFLNEIIDFVTADVIKVDANSISLQKKDNVSKKVNMPIEIYDYLKLELYPQYEWLSQISPEIAQLWYSKHFDNSKESTIDNFPKIIELKS